MKKNHDTSAGRRTFLKAAAGFMGTTLFGSTPFRAFAQSTSLKPSDRCFVFVYFDGGWDQLLAFDPRDPNVFTPDRVSQTRIQPGYSFTDPSIPTRPIVPGKRPGAALSNITFGPAVGALADHYDLMTVVRGINMTTLAHEEGRRYFITGKRPIGAAARGSSTATEVVGQMAPPVPIPSIAYNVETYNDRYPGSANALKVSKSSDLLLALAPSPTQLDSELEKQLVDFSGQPISCEAAAYGAGGVGTMYSSSRGQMRQVISSRLDNAFRFEQNTDEAKAVRLAYKLGESGPYDDAAGRAALVATALKKGISQCVSINLAGGLDTHFGSQTTHALNLRKGFEALALLVNDLRNTPHPYKAGDTFMDHTTILVYSEFARTPLLNAASGRDHHLTNSCLMMGAGLKHNTVFGRSGDIAMAPAVVNLGTGESDPINGQNILPDHIIATVLASAGLDYSITRVEPLRSLLA
ncbi:Tat (twin-arginine translocation) pathway signal sequence domain protein [Cystobacter fuscus DSM 2262]|uniref:Tat (Twin-arginine translocation) pathway signal sequence domain protein n=1 Tax=Cystobacter fuscus (strain ATCC 25194 / DSM 2262 / NBRC 100088 / M29) TaxID=1242864 RepID=S9PBE6_CYSF2|nr:DUF1501 domain-containing protein [Cystobacter fuscus]EPX60446.1 Tat (twin-arginine translocation) pathway signal sequence domain protein [Cystobacter fuscus DSM 2262]